MRKVNLILVAFILLVSITIKAQTPHTDYFVGKWEVVAVGTPGGNSKLTVNLTRKNGKLEGNILSANEDPITISKVEETTNSVKVYFRRNFFKINLALVKKDDTHTLGSLMDKYKATGVRLN